MDSLLTWLIYLTALKLCFVWEVDLFISLRRVSQKRKWRFSDAKDTKMESGFKQKKSKIGV